MDITSDSILLKSISNESLSEYLMLSGWKRERNAKWFVFQGNQDAYGEPLEVVLPRDNTSSERTLYQASAVNLLSALSDEDPQTVVQRIKYYDSDVFTIYNTDVQSRDSIPLQRASRQIAALRRLVGHSAWAEYDLSPYHESKLNSLGRRMIGHYSFEHTVRGSFGLTICSRISSNIFAPVQLSFWNPFFTNSEDETIQLAPTERRVMERIVRGFTTVELSVRQSDPSILVDEYTSGFNANMCNAASALHQDHLGPIRCNVLWSPKLAPSKDVVESRNTELGDKGVGYLKAAAKKLRDFTPEPTRVLGNVYGVIANGRPFDNDETTERFAVVLWENRDRKVRILIPVDRAEYEIAYECHRTQTPIEALGVVAKVGNEWRMSETISFKTI